MSTLHESYLKSDQSALLVLVSKMSAPWEFLKSITIILSPEGNGSISTHMNLVFRNLPSCLVWIHRSILIFIHTHKINGSGVMTANFHINHNQKAITVFNTVVIYDSVIWQTHLLVKVSMQTVNTKVCTSQSFMYFNTMAGSLNLHHYAWKLAWILQFGSQYNCSGLCSQWWVRDGLSFTPSVCSAIFMVTSVHGGI